jgi:hypothetical protein
MKSNAYLGFSIAIFPVRIMFPETHLTTLETLRLFFWRKQEYIFVQEDSSKTK